MIGISLRTLMAAAAGREPVTPTVTGLDATLIPLYDLYRINRKFVYQSGTVGPAEVGTKPANGVYDAVWTRDHAYVLWHMPRLFPSGQRQAFIANRLTRRSDGTGGVPVDLIADRIEINGTRQWQPGGRTDYVWDGIHFVILAMWSDWQVTGDDSLFTTWESVLATCMAAVPVDGNGAVYSDPADPLVDYGFHDALIKTGALSYGTALHVWAYKMMAEMNGESGSGTYTTLMEAAQTGLATLRKGNDIYMGSTTSDTGVDDIWATALIVAEGLIVGQDRIDSAQALKDAYDAGTITQNGWVRSRTSTLWSNNINMDGDDAYQQGGYWAHSLYDLVRAVSLVSQSTAQEIADDAVTELQQQVTDESTVGVNTAPYEWFFNAVNSTPKGYTAHLATFSRFADASPSRTLTHDTTPNLEDDFSSDTSANYTLSSITYDGTNEVMTGSGTPDGKYFVHNTSLAAAQGVSLDVTATNWTNIFPAIILRYTDAANYIFCHFVAQPSGTFQMVIYERIASTNNNRASNTSPMNAGDRPATGAYVNIRAWAVGSTVIFEALGHRLTATMTTHTGAGQVGGRHGASSTGISRFDNFKAWELTSGALPADIALVSDSTIIAVGEEQAGIVTNADLIDAEGDIVSAGSASVGATSVV